MKISLKKIVCGGIFFSTATLALVSCSKKKDWEFVGTAQKSQVMMLNGENPVKEKTLPLPDKVEEYEEGEIFNPWSEETRSNESAENGEYSQPQEINIETFRHIQRFTTREIGEGLEMAFEPVDGNPWVTKITKDERILFASVATDSKYNQIYKTVATLSGTRAFRIPGVDGGPDLLELIDDGNGNLKELIVIPKGLPDLKVNEEFKCFEFSEKEKYGLASGQLYIFPNAEDQKNQNMALVKYNTKEYSQPATYSELEEQIAQKSELMLIAKTSEQLTFDGKTSYWFQAKRGEKTFWVPGYNLYLQAGTFNRLNLTTEVVFIPFDTECKWFRITDDYPEPKGNIRAGQIVYVPEISSGSYEKENRTSKIYKTSYPEESEIFGIYLELLDDLHGTFNNYSDGAKELNYPAEKDPEVKIYEAPSTQYRVLAHKYDESTMPQDTDSYTLSVSGYTDIQDVVNNTYGRWFKVSSPVNGFVFVPQAMD